MLTERPVWSSLLLEPLAMLNGVENEREVLVLTSMMGEPAELGGPEIAARMDASWRTGRRPDAWDVA